MYLRYTAILLLIGACLLPAQGFAQSKAAIDSNETINRELAAAGIVIPFPQRDIHLDTSQTLEVNFNQVPADKPQS